MKLKIIFPTIICATLGLNTAKADNPNNCTWARGGSDERTIKITAAPAVVNLNRVAIGNVMASSSSLRVHSESGMMKCPFPEVRTIIEAMEVRQGPLEEGFTNVYKTGLKGVGVRFRAGSSWKYTIPYADVFPNGYGTTETPPQEMKLEFIRTSRDVAQGQVNLNYIIRTLVNDWDALYIHINGTVNFKTTSYFSGCSGTERFNIPMGRPTIKELNNIRGTAFNLDVLCEGMPANTQVPVKVYFEGSSDGPGRLNLEPGGATGVEISLLSGTTRLPFTKGSAMRMNWVRSETKGEIYRLPVVAKYIKKGSLQVEPGKANATLNYILEYN